MSSLEFIKKSSQKILHDRSVTVGAKALFFYILNISYNEIINKGVDEMNDNDIYITKEKDINNPNEIFSIWNGGLAIHGGIIAVFITVLYYCKKKDYNLLLVLDFIVVGLIIAQAIGRWGNFFNGEAHGPITTLSYLKSLYLPNFIIKGMHIDGNYYIPTFLYESLWCLLGFIIMYLIRNKKFVKVGFLTGFYFIWYGIERFYVESLRTDSLMLFNFKIAQLVSLAMIVIGFIIFIYSFKNSNIYREEKYD